MRRVAVTVFAICCAGMQGATGNDAPKEVISNGGLIHTLTAAAVVGQPYSAVQVTRMVRTLGDGTTIKRNGHHNVARDSQGRVRVERRMANAQNGEPETVMVFVLDPVGHTLTTWMTGAKATKVATLVRLPEKKGDNPGTEFQNASTQAKPLEDGRPQPVVTTEDLGTDTVNGLPVTVVKKTTVIPPGRAGNNAPITTTNETWTSQDLKLILKEQWNDPRSGERTVQLEQFSRAEPDPSLFRAPAGYAVKDIKETFKELAARLSEMQN